MSAQVEVLLDLIRKQGKQIDSFTELIIKLNEAVEALEARVKVLERQTE